MITSSFEGGLNLLQTKKIVREHFKRWETHKSQVSTANIIPDILIVLYNWSKFQLSASIDN